MYYDEEWERRLEEQRKKHYAYLRQKRELESMGYTVDSSGFVSKKSGLGPTGQLDKDGTFTPYP